MQGNSKVEFRWQDRFGLTGQQPFTLSISGREDEAPTLSCEGLPRMKVVLDSEMLTFKVRAQDDFGVKRVGLEWAGVVEPTMPRPAKGERILAGGGHDKENLDDYRDGSPPERRLLDIEPQVIQVRR